MQFLTIVCFSKLLKNNFIFSVNTCNGKCNLTSKNEHLVAFSVALWHRRNTKLSDFNNEAQMRISLGVFPKVWP